MEIKVKFFSAVRREVGEPEIILTLDGPLTAEEVLKIFMADHPRLMDLKENIMISLNHKLVEGSAPVSHGDEIAFFPPVSGG